MNVPLKIDLKGKVAVVTGGGGMLCGAMAEALGACGAKVAVLDLRKEAADKVAEQIVADGGEAIGVAANVLEKESLEEAAKIVTEKFGACDILLNGAGGNHPKGTTSKEFLEATDLAQTIEGVNTFYDLDP
ncbi:MAG: SDR family NAD(P)-dependent oxidoreductase, partial [Victivallales bacterium]|nr:SDR family NAD(P)-dependent oxidoreductase [Victivallales bacterium]